MLKKLRLKFVLVNMLIVTILLAAVMGLLYHFTRVSLEAESIRMMQAIAENPFSLGRPDDETNTLRLPYFALQISMHGQLLASGGGYFDLSDEQALEELIQTALTSDAQTGLLRKYNLRYYRRVTPQSQTLVFADVSGERAALSNLLKTCAGIGTLAFLVFLGVSFLLARWAVRPVDEAWKQQRQFVADASHELKTPLTVIMTNAELLQSPDYYEAARAQFSGSILTMSQQMRKLVERLLELARADSGQTHLVFSRLELSGLAAEALLPFEAVFFEKGMRLESELEPGIFVNADAGQLRQLIEILLDNAQKYAPEGALVCLRLQRLPKSRCRLSLSNTGPALSQQELSDIFKRFYRADPARSRDGSFGLGLSIAASIAQQHHGKIYAQSQDGENRFIVELPTV